MRGEIGSDGCSDVILNRVAVLPREWLLFLKMNVRPHSINQLRLENIFAINSKANHPFELSINERVNNRFCCKTPQVLNQIM